MHILSLCFVTFVADVAVVLFLFQIAHWLLSIIPHPYLRYYKIEPNSYHNRRRLCNVLEEYATDVQETTYGVMAVPRFQDLDLTEILRTDSETLDNSDTDIVDVRGHSDQKFRLYVGKVYLSEC